jgi:hypothetical protein
MKFKLFITIVLIAVFSFTTVSFANSPKQNKGNKKYSQNRGRQNPHYYNEDHYYHGKRRYHNRRHIPDYYHYRHWKRWKDWEREYKHNKHRYKGGHYERDNHGVLMFKFCDPSGPCFSFSIYD